MRTLSTPLFLANPLAYLVGIVSCSLKLSEGLIRTLSPYFDSSSFGKIIRTSPFSQPSLLSWIVFSRTLSIYHLLYLYLDSIYADLVHLFRFLGLSGMPFWLNFFDIGFIRYHVLKGLCFWKWLFGLCLLQTTFLSLLNRTYSDFVLCFSISRPFWETMFVILFVESTIY